MLDMRFIVYFSHKDARRYYQKPVLRYLLRLCALTRTVARRSQRQRPGPSAPGRPPNAHAGDGGFRQVLFGVDRRTKTAVVGPKAYRAADLPAVHEFGERLSFANGKVAVYPPRPFMNPAQAKALAKAPAIWADIERKLRVVI